MEEALRLLVENCDDFQVGPFLAMCFNHPLQQGLQIHTLACFPDFLPRRVFQGFDALRLQSLHQLSDITSPLLNPSRRSVGK
jgi:hypothetical protein